MSKDSNNNQNTKTPLDIKIIVALMFFLIPLGFIGDIAQAYQSGLILHGGITLIQIIGMYISLFIILQMKFIGVLAYTFFGYLSPILAIFYKVYLFSGEFSWTPMTIFNIYAFIRISGIMSNKIKISTNQIVLSLLLFLLIVTGTNVGSSVDRYLFAIANETNEETQTLIDPFTRFENVIAGPGKIMVYTYTLTTASKDEILSKYGTLDAFKTVTEEITLTKLREDMSVEYYRENNVKLVYKYKDKNGIDLIEISFDGGKY